MRKCWRELLADSPTLGDAGRNSSRRGASRRRGLSVERPLDCAGLSIVFARDYARGPAYAGIIARQIKRRTRRTSSAHVRTDPQWVSCELCAEDRERSYAHAPRAPRNRAEIGESPLYPGRRTAGRDPHVPDSHCSTRDLDRT